jgi:hypothetical protein
MDDELDQLIDDSVVGEPPRKKRKTGKDTFMNPNNVQLEPESEELVLKRKELKAIMLRYPDLDLEKITRLHTDICRMHPNDVEILLENSKIEIGLKNPNQNAKSMLSLIGVALHKITGLTGIYKKMESDDSLITALEHYLPDPTSKLSIPMQIVSRISSHIADEMFGAQ